MKFYFINPRIPLSFAGNEYASRMVFRRYTNPPLGLLTAAAMVPREHDVQFTDENAREIDWDSDCDAVCLSGMHLQKMRIREIAKRFRERGKRIILGGPSVMAVPDEYREVADIRIVGEAEKIWPECIRDLEKGIEKDAYYAQETVSLGDSPIPRYDLIAPRDYIAMSMQTTRGCPFSCEFCDIITLYGRKVRAKPIPQVMKEIEYLTEFGADNFNIVDDNFIGNQHYAAELLEAFIKFREGQKRPFHFSTQLTINVTKKPELLRLLRRAGCRSVFIGIETPRISSLEETRKFQNSRSDLLKDIETVHSYGIAVYSGLMVGFDHDDHTIFKEQVDFLNEAKIPHANPNKVGALPGTPLYKRIVEEGRLLPDTEFHLVAFKTNVRPKLMTIKEFNERYVWMIQELDSPENSTERIWGELGRLDSAGASASNYRAPVVWLAFIWIFLWYLFDPNRAKLLSAFFKIFPKVLVRHPKVVDTAVVHLVHYRHIVRLVNALSAEVRDPSPSPQAFQDSLEVSS